MASSLFRENGQPLFDFARPEMLHLFQDCQALLSQALTFDNIFSRDGDARKAVQRFPNQPLRIGLSGDLQRLAERRRRG